MPFFDFSDTFRQDIMTANWQTPLALLVVLVAAGLIVRGVLRKRKTPGCGSGCGCPTDKFKAGLKK